MPREKPAIEEIGVPDSVEIIYCADMALPQMFMTYF